MASLTVILIFAAILALTYFAIQHLGLFQSDTSGSSRKANKDSQPKKQKEDLSENLVEPDFSSDSDEDDDSEVAVAPREFTLDELRQFDGEQEDKIYVSVKGQVFDVTGTAFYSKTSDHHTFAGHDVSINLSRNSLDTSTLDKFDLSILSESERDELESNLDFYESKYVNVGWLKEWNDANPKSAADKKND